MPITTTLGQLAEAQPALERLLAKEWPVATAFAIARVIRSIQPELTAFHEQRDRLVRQYGAARPDGVVEVLPEHHATFFAHVQELASVAVTIDRAPLALNGDHPITVADVLILGPLLADDDDG